jgi:hypothetical protein
MAIRDRFRRAMHKSESSSNLAPSESNNTLATTTTTPTIITTTTTSETSSQESSLRREPTEQTAKFAFPWSKTDTEKTHRREEKEKKRQEKQQLKQKKSIRHLHPRDRPLTSTNIRYQEQLGDWDFSFGSSSNRMSQLITDESTSSFGVSPCCTRPGSINGDVDDDYGDDSALSPATEVSHLRRAA